jgi:UDP-N-acetylmuramoyl-tripeptide--D-alanyl-D-alanine ligase
MRGWQPARVAGGAGARIVADGERAGAEPGPTGASVDSRTLAPGELFVGLRGERADGGEHAAEALAAGAWGVMVAPEHAERVVAQDARGVVLSHADPLSGLQALAGAWRAHLGERGARVLAITGSTGKTSTKDILAALLGSRLRVISSPENLNTEIGMPLAILAAPVNTELLVLEMAMRGPGQIAELAAIARPEVGVIVNVGPVHLELLGSLQAIAAAKAELIAALAPGAGLVIPAAEPLLAPYLRADLRTITFGPGGDVALAQPPSAGASSGAPHPQARDESEVLIRIAGGALGNGAAKPPEAEELVRLRPSFAQAHNLLNLLAAMAAARALGITPGGRLEVSFSSLRGERLRLPGGVVLINDCYNANPMSMLAAIDDLADTAPARRVAVLGDMLELGERAREFHRQVGEHAAERGIEVLVAVGPLAAEMGAGFGGETHAVPDARAAAQALPKLLRANDTVLVKGSRGVGLELVSETLGGQGGVAGGEPSSPDLIAGARSR